MNVNVNTLTTEAATNMLSLAGGNLANITSTSIHNANLDIANQYGISIKEEPEALVSSKPSLIINADGSFNTSIDDYGLALAIRSVLDNNPGMQIKEAFKALATNPLYATKKIETTAGLIDWSSAVYGFGANFLKKFYAYRVSHHIWQCQQSRPSSYCNLHYRRCRRHSTSRLSRSHDL